MRLTTVQPPSVAGVEPDRESLSCMTALVSLTHAVRVSRDTPEPTSSGSPPDDARGESRPVKPDGDDMSDDGSARDSTTGRPRSEGGTLPFEVVGEGPETEPACRVPTVWEAPSFTAGEDVTTTRHPEAAKQTKTAPAYSLYFHVRVHGIYIDSEIISG